MGFPSSMELVLYVASTVLHTTHVLDPCEIICPFSKAA